MDLDIPRDQRHTCSEQMHKNRYIRPGMWYDQGWMYLSVRIATTTFFFFSPLFLLPPPPLPQHLIKPTSARPRPPALVLLWLGISEAKNSHSYPLLGVRYPLCTRALTALSAAVLCIPLGSTATMTSHAPTTEAGLPPVLIPSPPPPFRFRV